MLSDLLSRRPHVRCFERPARVRDVVSENRIASVCLIDDARLVSSVPLETVTSLNAEFVVIHRLRTTMNHVIFLRSRENAVRVQGSQPPSEQRPRAIGLWPLVNRTMHPMALRNQWRLVVAQHDGGGCPEWQIHRLRTMSVVEALALLCAIVNVWAVLLGTQLHYARILVRSINSRVNNLVVRMVPMRSGLQPHSGIVPLVTTDGEVGSTVDACVSSIPLGADWLLRRDPNAFE